MISVAVVDKMAQVFSVEGDIRYNRQRRGFIRGIGKCLNAIAVVLDIIFVFDFGGNHVIAIMNHYGWPLTDFIRFDAECACRPIGILCL